MSEMTKERLLRYLYIRHETEARSETLTRLKNAAELPATKESDGSQKTGVNRGKMETAVIRYMEEEAAAAPIIEANRREMLEIREAIKGLDDPLEREVLRLRYIASDTTQRNPWRDIAVAIYGDDDEKDLMAVYRIHARALHSLGNKD